LAHFPPTSKVFKKLDFVDCCHNNEVVETCFTTTNQPSIILKKQLYVIAEYWKQSKINNQKNGIKTAN
jgi:hypothetical protein